MSPAPAPDLETPGVETGPKRTIVWALVLIALALIIVPIVVARIVGVPEGEIHVFEIPAGTAARLAAGEDVEVLPSDLDFNLRDRLVVTNYDSETHQIGPFIVAPGAQIDEKFSDAVSFNGFCSLHSDASINIDVKAAS